jgi:hypothetical protein
MGFVKLFATFLRICVGLGVTFAGLGAVLAFGMFAWIGMPLLAVGLGLLSSAIDEVGST